MLVNTLDRSRSRQQREKLYDWLNRHHCRHTLQLPNAPSIVCIALVTKLASGPARQATISETSFKQFLPLPSRHLSGG